MASRNTDLESLFTLVPPGECAFETGSTALWVSVERKIGIELPLDYLNFTRRYGSGGFVDDGFTLGIHNPFKPLFPQVVEFNKRIITQDNVFELGSWSLSGDEQGDEGHIWWEKTGLPDEWPIFVRAGSNPLQRFDMPLPTFLLRAFRNEIRVHHFPVFRNVRFVPHENKHRPPCCFCGFTISPNDSSFVTLTLRTVTGEIQEIGAHSKCLHSHISANIAVIKTENEVSQGD
jgi:hypothetical protein